MKKKEEKKNNNIGKYGRWIGSDLKLFEGKIIEELIDDFKVNILNKGGIVNISKNKFHFDDNIETEL